MAAIKIIHASDFHLDSAFGGLPEEKSRQRRQESRQLMDRLAALVNAEQAQLVLLTGDLFDSVRAYPETVERLQAALASMTCPVFITPGNHDPLVPGSPYLEGKWPENVHIFRSEDLTAVELPELNCVVYGAAFTSPQRQGEALQNFSAPADGKIHIGDNDLLKIHLLNSAMKMSTERGRGKLVKVNPTLHIDGTAALLCALCVRQKWYGEIGEQLKN